MKVLAYLMLVVLLVTGCGNAGVSTSDEEQAERIVTDMAGREVVVPEDIEKIFCAEPVCAIYLYNLAPEKLAGWNYEPTDEEKVLLLEGYGDLDVFGMGSSINYEAVIASDVDFALISYEAVNDALLESIEELEANLNISVFAIDSSLVRAGEVYEILGEVIGAQEQGEKLSDYVEKSFDEIVEIPEEERKSVYYGNGVGSLETAPVGSVSAQELEMLYIDNVADVAMEGSNRVQVSSEQILQWDADYMLVNGEPSEGISGDTEVDEIMSNPVYSELSAVQNDQVIGVPKSPFSFIARPTGPNRLMGIEWLKATIYPEYYPEDIVDVTREFYELFYHIELSDDQIKQLLSLE